MDTFDDFINSNEIKEYNNELKYFDTTIDTVFSINELRIIFNAIDKTDYTHMALPRWFELQSILEQITKTKILHSNAVLSKMTLRVIHETWPPQNRYIYHYDYQNDY
jgi:hypothetical protein